MAKEKNKKESQLQEDNSDESKEISKKKIIYIDIDDEITDIFSKIEPLGIKHIYLVVPQRAMLFQSLINLKILLKKTREVNKKIYLITNDPNGIYLAQQLEIPVFDKANNEGKPSLFSAEEDEKLRITPLKASVNAIDEDTPTRLFEKKLSISELLRKPKTKSISEKKSLTSPVKNKNKKYRHKPKLTLISPNRHALIGLIAVSLIILLVIIYVALPGVTIHLTPSASVLEKSVNITLADYNKNKVELELHPHHTIASYPISTTVEKTITHFSTGKRFSEEGRNAGGKITIINTTPNQWPLIARTRFQTNDGIVFRIKDGVTVPAATSTGPGKLEVYVVADPTDETGEVIGERGNIGPGKFFLPGLREDSRSKIYAESTESMTGGITDYVTYVSEEDLDAAEERIIKELNKAAIPTLEQEIIMAEGANAGENSYTLLDGEGGVKFGEPEVNIPTDIQGQDLTEFEISGSLTVTGVYYDSEAMLEILKNELLLKKSPEKELLRINEDSTSYRIFDWDEASGKIKVTANIKGIEQYKIDPDTEEGQKLLEKIREHILGADIDTASRYIQNLPEINIVEVESWPAWAPTIPNLPENIEFEVREAVMVN